MKSSPPSSVKSKVDTADAISKILLSSAMPLEIKRALRYTPRPVSRLSEIGTNLSGQYTWRQTLERHSGSGIPVPKAAHLNPPPFSGEHKRSEPDTNS